jgi:hypothetical protein
MRSFDWQLTKVAAFPKQVFDETLYEELATCHAYITDAVHLCKKFSEYQELNSKVQLEPSEEFVELLSNAAWYVLELLKAALW